MADTKISALTAISGGLASGDKFAVADASDLSASYSVTAANVKTYTNNAPVFAAGSASAATWPVLTSGTVMTTAEDGAWELDANCLYMTTDASNRGYVPIRHFIRCDSTHTLTNTTSEQALFNSPSNGRLTLETGTYRFKGLFAITSMEGAGASNAAIDILGAGTATCAAWLFHGAGEDDPLATPASRTGSFSVTQQSAASILTGVAGSVMGFHMHGTFEVTGAGTIIPSITLVVGAAAVVAIGSFMWFERIGSTSVVSLGQWD
jgi:hypothetical protein